MGKTTGPYFIELAASILLVSGVGLLSSLGPSGVSTAEAQSSKKGTQRESTAQQQAQPEASSGFFTIVWAHPKPGSGVEETEPRYTLNDDQGGQTELLLDESLAKPAGGPLAFNGKRVKVKGTRVPDKPKHLKVEAIQFEQSTDAATAESKMAAGESAAEPLVSNSKPWVTIGCRFADSTNATPHDQAWFETQQSNTEPGMDHFWRQNSYDGVNLSGSQVKAWYNLPQPRSYYLPGGSLDWDRAANDCTAAADKDVTFTNFGGINLFFNQDLGCCAWGGSTQLTRDGQTKVYAMTWMPPWGYNNNRIVAHEMGHGFGLPHSSGPYNATYDSKWDPMSSGGTCSSVHSVYGCLGDHTISFHKDMMGWIPSSRKYTASSYTDNITLDRLAQPASTTSYLMAKIPIPASTTRFYTVEVRRLAGYDDTGPIPGEAVVMHKVDTTLGDRNARVVDSDNNGNPNDSGAMWLPGETFKDAANGISVKVTGATSSGYHTIISPKPPTVTDTSPDNAATGVARNTNATATFSEEMNPSTLETTDPATQTSPSVKLYERVKKRIRRHGKVRRVWRWVPVSAEVKCNTPSCQTVTLDPYGTSGTLLDPYRSHLVVISTGAKDAADNALAQNYSWTFTTGAS